MAFGIQVENTSGALVVDSDAHGLHYVGQATFLDNTAETNNFFFRNRVHRRYSFTLPNSSAFPCVAIRPEANRWMSLQSVRRSSPGSPTWHAYVYSADSSAVGFSEADMTATASAEVHVFSSHVASGDSFGLRLFDSSGAISWDFGAKPLFVRQVANFPQRTDRTTYLAGDAISASGVSSPLLINARAHGKSNMRIGAVGSHEDSQYVFQLDGSGDIKRVQLGTFYERGDSEGEPYTPQPDWELPARTVFIVDAADYL